jgi:hypothetical protein
VTCPTSSSAPPACMHSDSSGSHRHKWNTKNPRFYSLKVLFSFSVFYLFSQPAVPGVREPLVVC